MKIIPEIERLNREVELLMEAQKEREGATGSFISKLSKLLLRRS